MIKKIIFTAVLASSFPSQAFTQEEWVTFINDSINVKQDLSWDYDMVKMKSYTKFIKNEDIKILETISKSDDIQISQGSKYLLASQGSKSSDFILSNYLDDDNLKNGLYYMGLNLINLPEKKPFFDKTISLSNSLETKLNTKYEKCENFNDYYDKGGKNFTFENYDDFYSKRDLISNYTHADLFYLEIDLQDKTYPITVTFYKNRYNIQNKDDDQCIKINSDNDYIHLQKIFALYKQYDQQTTLTLLCDKLSKNNLLKSRFSYFCSNVNLKEKK